MIHFGAWGFGVFLFVAFGAGFLFGANLGERGEYEKACRDHFGKTARQHEGKCFVRESDGTLRPAPVTGGGK